MVGPERRHSSRTTLGTLPYILVEPDNGAMVSNVSEEGLSFQSVAPVVSNGSARIHFWFTDCDQRVRADGKLAWTDPTKTIGGLQFAPALSQEARQQIHKWISEAMPPLAAEEPAGSSDSSHVLSACTVSAPPDPPLAEPSGSIPVARPEPKLVSAVSTATPVVPPIRQSTAVTAHVPAPAALIWRGLQRFNSFSRGFAAGFAVAAVVAAAFFFHSYRRSLGESIIRLGEHLASSQRSPESVTAAPPQDSPQTSYSVPRATLSAAAPMATSRADKPASHSTVSDTTEDTQDVTIELIRPVTTLAPAPPPIPKSSPVSKAGAAPVAPPRIPLSSSAANDSGPVLPTADTLPQLVSGKRAIDPPVESYLEVAKFKDELPANTTMDRLSQLGFHATVIQKGYLWMNSYHVLVGPYRSEGAAKAARKGLLSRGYKPQSFERGSRYFWLPPSLQLGGRALPMGTLIITWESYADAATVTLLQSNQVVATAEAKWVKHQCTEDHNAVVYRTNADGSRTLLEFHFRGLNKALAFRGSPALSSSLRYCCTERDSAVRSTTFDAALRPGNTRPNLQGSASFVQLPSPLRIGGE
jgi:hypothetical protein